MKLFLHSYFKKNLGDDIFIYMLLKRYKAEIFSYEKDDYGKIFDNDIKIYRGKIYKLINIFLKIITFRKFGITELLSKRADVSLLLGGSMFMEKKDKKTIFPLKKPYYILGSNFGPYFTEEYYNKFYDIFKKAEDVCFREKYSKELFAKLDNVRYASDIVFDLDVSDVKNINNKKVVISIIDCERKIDEKYRAIYEYNILEMIYFFINKGYEVTLMSFCEAEGDEKAINRIISQVTEKSVLDNISTYFYDGDIKEALEVLGDSQIIIGSRFHANILGMVLGKTIIPIAYSDKTLNVLYDIGFKGKIFDIRQNIKFKFFDLTEKDLNYKFDISKQKLDAQKHFINLDKVLERRKG